MAAATITNLTTQLQEAYIPTKESTFKSLFPFRISHGDAKMMRQIDTFGVKSKRFSRRSLTCSTINSSKDCEDQQNDTSPSSSRFSTSSSYQIESGASSPTSPALSTSSHNKKRRGSASQEDDEYDASAPRTNVIPGFPEHYHANQWKTTEDQRQSNKGLSLKTVVNMLRWGSTPQTQQ